MAVTTTSTTPALADYLSSDDLDVLIARAFDEDAGPERRDITSMVTISRDARSAAVFTAREAGRLAGAAILPSVAGAVDSSVKTDCHLTDGAKLAPGDRIATIEGPTRSLLLIERTALNFMTHLSGIASLTARFVDAVAGTKAGIYDTRKTFPGLRALAKYAVACGGGRNHRLGLHDAVLIKDNHLAALGADWAAALRKAIDAVRAADPRPSFIQVEVDSVQQLRVVLPMRPDIVLLDNMSLDDLRASVALRDDSAPGVELEASGGVTLDTVSDIAQTGVDRISVGALTHSAPALDLGLDAL